MSLEDIVKVASPCRVPWSSMAGDERVKHCRQCKLDVYNLSSMSEDEALDFLAAAEGKERTCILFYRRSDGTIITRDCPKGVAHMKNLGTRLLRLVSGLLAFFLAISPAWAEEKDGDQSRTGREGSTGLPAMRLEDFVKNAGAGAEVVYGEYIPVPGTETALPAEARPVKKPEVKPEQNNEKAPGQALEIQDGKKSGKKKTGKKTRKTVGTSEKPAGK